MKKILAIVLTSVMLVSSSLPVCAAEPSTGSKSITAEDIQKLVDAIEALQKSNENLQQANQNLQDSNRNLQDSNRNLMNSNSNLQQSNQELKNSNQDLQDSNQDLQDSNQDLKDSNQELKNSNQELKNSNHELQNSNQKLVDSNSELLNSNDALISSNAALQSSVERLTAAINGKPLPPDNGSGGGSSGGSGRGSGSQGASNSAYYNGSIIYPVRKIEINGVKSNATFMVAQPDGGTMTSANNLAASLGGNLINAVVTSSPGVNFATARVNFFVGGVTDNDTIAVYQLQNGKWVQLSVSEIRKDHVIVNMTRHGVIVFIRVPALATTN